MNTISYPKTHKIVLVLLAVVILASMTLTGPAYAKTVPPTFVPSPGFCTKNCLVVTDIVLTRGSVDTDPITPEGIVAVVTLNASNSSGKLGEAAGAMVYAYWTLPSGMNVLAVAQTNGQGQAVFQITETPGTFTFTIFNVQKNLYTFDKLKSVLTKTIR
jgi:hypothetical protein